MTTLMLRNIVFYALIGCAIAVANAIAIPVGMGAFAPFGDSDILAPARGQVSAMLSLVVTGGGLWLAANRPRVGSEELAADADKLRKAGKSRRGLKVVPKLSTERLPDAQVAQIVAAVKAEMRATPAQEDAPPASNGG